VQVSFSRKTFQPFIFSYLITPYSVFAYQDCFLRAPSSVSPFTVTNNLKINALPYQIGILVILIKYFMAFNGARVKILYWYHYIRINLNDIDEKYQKKK
jgi:hypothetical protein